MKQAVAMTALEKLLPLPAMSNFLRGIWNRCDVGGLSVHQELAQCLLTNSSWLPIQSTGVLTESNHSKSEKKRRTAAVITSLVSFDIKFPSTRISIFSFQTIDDLFAELNM